MHLKRDIISQKYASNCQAIPSVSLYKRLCFGLAAHGSFFVTTLWLLAPFPFFNYVTVSAAVPTGETKRQYGSGADQEYSTAFAAAQISYQKFLEGGGLEEI
jgi:hypothetical protein